MYKFKFVSESGFYLRRILLWSTDFFLWRWSGERREMAILQIAQKFFFFLCTLSFVLREAAWLAWYVARGLSSDSGMRALW